MKRRRLLRYAQVALLAGVAPGVATQLQTAQAQGGGSLSIQSLGHSCFIFSGGGLRILVNPFKSVGCTAKLSAPRVSSDLVMISSRLLDEGYVEGLPGRPKLLFQPGAYRVSGLKIQGVRAEHDRVGGFRFGVNVCWSWIQGGIRVVHLGGIASPITLEQKILLGRPDVLFVPVGGGDKSYTPEEAKAAIAMLEPRLVVPTQYRTSGADPKTCAALPLDDFLNLMKGTPVRRGGSSITVSSGNLPNPGPAIQVMS
jgi:L-ascorbate metabolism protein UlaG (beta-lactamase superfamily)